MNFMQNYKIQKKQGERERERVSGKKNYQFDQERGT